MRRRGRWEVLTAVIFLTLHILFTSSFGLIVKYAQQKRGHLLAVGATNYIWAALLGLGSALFSWTRPSLSTVAIGALGGVAYVVSYLFLIRAMNFTGISIPTAIVRLSVLVPVLASIFLWREQPNDYQVLGLLLTCLALPLLSFDARTQASNGFKGPLGIILALFFTTGGCFLSTKAFDATGRPEERPVFLAILFTTAALVAVAALRLNGAKVGRFERGAGLALGTVNLVGNFFLLLALAHLPGIIVFPVASSLSLVLTTLVAAWAWGERLGRWGVAGLTTAIMAVVFLNLRG